MLTGAANNAGEAIRAGGGGGGTGVGAMSTPVKRVYRAAEEGVEQENERTPKGSIRNSGRINGISPRGILAGLSPTPRGKSLAA